MASSFPYLVSKQARLNWLTDCKGVHIDSKFDMLSQAAALHKLGIVVQTSKQEWDQRYLLSRKMEAFCGSRKPVQG